MTATTLTRYLSEYIMHGGGLFTRNEVYSLWTKPTTRRAGIGSADWWAFRPEAIDTTDMAPGEYMALRSIAERIMREE